MRVAIVVVFLLAAVSGCTTKSAARREAQAAFQAGQQQAVQQQSLGTSIRVVGDVKNTLIEWRDGLSLSQAIVEAEYQSERDPVDIVIIRRGQIISINPKRLLRGHDELLEPGDRIELRR